MAKITRARIAPVKPPAPPRKSFLVYVDFRVLAVVDRVCRELKVSRNAFICGLLEREIGMDGRKK